MSFNDMLDRYFEEKFKDENEGLKILQAPMQENDAGAKTIGEYLIKLSQEVWSEGEYFSGKRPFGNSGWDNEIYIALAKNDFIKHKCEVWGDKDADEVDYYEFDEKAGNKLINMAYKALYEYVKSDENSTVK